MRLLLSTSLHGCQRGASSNMPLGTSRNISFSFSQWEMSINPGKSTVRLGLLATRFPRTGAFASLPCFSSHFLES